MINPGKWLIAASALMFTGLGLVFVGLHIGNSFFCVEGFCVMGIGMGIALREARKIPTP